MPKYEYKEIETAGKILCDICNVDMQRRAYLCKDCYVMYLLDMAYDRNSADEK